MVIFIVDFEYDLRIDKKYAIKPVSAISAIFCTENFVGKVIFSLDLEYELKSLVRLNQELPTLILD